MSILDELKQNYSPLALITDDLLSGVEDSRFEIIERDGETTISVYMLSSKVSELFELHGRKMPKVMSRIVNKCHAVLINLSSDRVRVFVSDENQIGNKFDILYPMHSDIDTDVYEKVGTDLDVDLNLNIVSHYTISYVNSDGIIRSYTFNEAGEACGEFSELMDTEFTEYSDYEVLNEVDCSDHFCMQLVNLDNDNTSLTIYSNPIETSYTETAEILEDEEREEE